MQTRFLATLVVSLAAAMMGCQGGVYQPINGDSFAPGGKNSVQGATTSPAIGVTLLAFNHRTNAWDALATATSSSTPTHVYGADIYDFTLAYDLGALPNRYDYTGAGVDFGISLRTRDQSGNFLETADSHTTECVRTKLSQGVDFLTATLNCKATNSPDLNLFIVG